MRAETAASHVLCSLMWDANNLQVTPLPEWPKIWRAEKLQTDSFHALRMDGWMDVKITTLHTVETLIFEAKVSACSRSCTLHFDLDTPVDPELVCCFIWVATRRLHSDLKGTWSKTTFPLISSFLEFNRGISSQKPPNRLYRPHNIASR